MSHSIVKNEDLTLDYLESKRDFFTDTLEEISKYIFTGRYARYLPNEKRRETWGEAVDRVQNMHLNKFSHLSSADLAEIEWAFSLVRSKRALPSMRSMQFGGKAVEASNARIYNCATRHVDSLRSFSEIFYLLLCGCGVGLGLSAPFMERLPDLVGPNDKTGTVLTYVVEDSIEGWSDSIEALLSCYFVNTAFSGRKIVFDFSRIRPAGAPIKTGGGKAPGYQGLKSAMLKIKHLLDTIIEVRHQARLKTIDAYDIVMHLADAVLSGGVRRSATSVMFLPDDTDMLTAKTGNWVQENPQRARSNNSVIIDRSKVTFEEFVEIVNHTREWGEPGFVFADDSRMLLNPCQPAWAPMLTEHGVQKMANISVGDKIWSETGWTTVVKKWSTGVKKVYRYETSAGVFYGTENHKLVSNGVKIEAKDCESVDILAGPELDAFKLAPEDIMAGLLIGDGSQNHKTGNQVLLNIGRNDLDYFDSEISALILDKKSEYLWTVASDIQHEELLPIPERNVPDRYFYAEPAKVAGFLRGLYSANGSVVNNRVTLKTMSAIMAERVQLMLSSLGIRSYKTTNRSKDVEFENGTYSCKESYDVNITVDRSRFVRLIGFIQEYKNEKIAEVAASSGKRSFDITSVTLVSEEEVFDITVDNDPHTYWTGGLNVSNCFEIGMLPITDDGVCGVQMCNLTTVNGSKVTCESDFFEAVKAAAIIGTLQASYTDFPYLNNASEKITRDEALLGVSITAMMDAPDIILDPEVQRRGAQVAVDTNRIWAQKLGINQAARVTAIKPEGTSTLAVGSMASGIHPSHARVMFRRIQANKLDNVYQFFKAMNPHMCEESVWSANKTDDVITFPVMLKPGALVKADLSALEHLDVIRSTQRNWVIPGTTEANNKNLHHSVSCTVIVKPEEWDGVVRYLFDNRGDFTAVALISASGDKDYAQSPNEAVVSVDDIAKFRELMWNFVPVDYSLLMEDEDGTSLMQEIACAGGACEIT